MRVFVYACETMYQGLHGVEDMRVVEVASVEEADEYGREMSEGVINSYSSTLESIEEVADEVTEDRDSEEWQEAYDEEFGQHLEWYVYPIDEEKAKGLSTDELDKLASEWGSDYFIEKYCGEVI